MGELALWEGSVWVWDLRWRRPLFVWETDLLNELPVVVARHSRVDMEDWWSWDHNPDGRYSVKSAYSSLLRGLPVEDAPDDVILQAVSRVWKSRTPSKVVAFSWQLLCLLLSRPGSLGFSLRLLFLLVRSRCGTVSFGWSLLWCSF